MIPPEVLKSLDEWYASIRPAPRPAATPQHHVVYTLTPVQPQDPDDPVSSIEFKVHVSTGHHYQNRIWTEPITPELQRIFGELDKAAAEMES